MTSPIFRLGGPPEYLDDPVDNPGSPIIGQYTHVAYADVRARGGQVSVEECSSADRFSNIAPGGTGETLLCFMIGKAFQPDGLFVAHDDPSGLVGLFGHGMVSYSGKCDTAGNHRDHSCRTSSTQVIPFHDKSDYCFDRNFDYCNTDNVQRIDGTPTPSPTPEPDPEPTQHAELLYAMYGNHTGTLIMVFDQPVVAHNPDNILFLHDISRYIDDETAPNLGDADLYTVDDKRQSAILMFTLDDTLRLAVTESLRTHGDLALIIEERAVYTAEGFTDITRQGDSPILTGIMVVR